MPSCLSIACLLLGCFTFHAMACRTPRKYHRVFVPLCIRPQFVETIPGRKQPPECAFLCDLKIDCQAFSVADGPCQLFVFNRCSKRVGDCGCTRRGQVFVRQQPGLPPGALCPAGFSDDLCDTKYKLMANITDWDYAKAAIDAVPGLVIFADGANHDELHHIRGILARDGLAKVLLGGRQLPGSEEPAGGWIWASCNTTIDTGLWDLNQPNNAGGLEDVVVANAAYTGLNDGRSSWYTFDGALAECLSPFN